MLTRKTFFIREHIGFLKLTDTYDILDPESQKQVGIAKERPGVFIQVLRLLVNKRLLPTQVYVYEGEDHENKGKLLFSLKRGVSLLRSRIDIRDKRGAVIGGLKSKVFSIGGAFYVLDAAGTEVAFVKGDWKGWNFRMMSNGSRELGTITKKWAGIGKELFTTADNYIVTLSPDATQAQALLLLAAGLAVDTVYKEA